MKTVLRNTKRFLAAFMALMMVILSMPGSLEEVFATEISEEAKATVSVVAAEGTYTIADAASVALSSATEATFTVTLTDAGATKAITGVTLDASGAEGTAKQTSDVSLTGGDNGVYTIAFTPDVAGTYAITPTVEALPVITELPTGNYTIEGIAAGATTAGTKTFTVTPNENYTISSVTVSEATDGEVALTSEETTHSFTAVYGKTYTIAVVAEEVQDPVVGATTLSAAYASDYANIQAPTIDASSLSDDKWDTSKDVVMSVVPADGYTLAYNNEEVTAQLSIDGATQASDVATENVSLTSKTETKATITIAKAALAGITGAQAHTAAFTLTLTGITAAEIPAETKQLSFGTGWDTSAVDVVVTNDGGKEVDEAISGEKLVAYNSQTYNPSTSAIFSVTCNDKIPVKSGNTAALYLIVDGDYDVTITASGNNPLSIVKDGKADKTNVFESDAITYKRVGSNVTGTYKWYGVSLGAMTAAKDLQIVTTARAQAVTVVNNGISYVSTTSGNNPKEKEEAKTVAYNGTYSIKPDFDTKDHQSGKVYWLTTADATRLTELEELLKTVAKNSADYTKYTKEKAAIEEKISENTLEANNGVYSIADVKTAITVFLTQDEKTGRTVSVSSGDPAATVYLKATAPTQNSSEWTLGGAWSAPNTNNGTAAFGKDYSFVLRYTKDAVTGLTVKYYVKSGEQSLTPVKVTNSEADKAAYAGLYDADSDTYVCTIPAAELTLNKTNEPISLVISSTAQFPITFTTSPKTAGIVIKHNGTEVEGTVQITNKDEDYTFTIEKDDAYKIETSGVKGSITGTETANVTFEDGQTYFTVTGNNPATYTVKKEALKASGATGVAVAVTAAADNTKDQAATVVVKPEGAVSISGNNPTWKSESADSTYVFYAKAEGNYGTLNKEKVTVKLNGTAKSGEGVITVGDALADGGNKGYQTITIKPGAAGALEVTIQPDFDDAKANTVTLKDAAGNYANIATTSQTAISVDETDSKSNGATVDNENKSKFNHVYDTVTLTYDTSVVTDSEKDAKIVSATVSGNNKIKTSVSDVKAGKQEIVLSDIPVAEENGVNYDLILTTEPLGLSEKLDVSLENKNARGVGTSVTTGDGVAYAKDVISVAAYAPYVTFTVTEKDGFTPSVQIGHYTGSNFSGTEIDAGKYTKSGDNRTYKLIVGKDIVAGSKDAIVVNATAEQKNINLIGFDESKAYLTVVVNNESVIDTKKDSKTLSQYTGLVDAGQTITVSGNNVTADVIHAAKGDKVSVKVTPKTNITTQSGNVYNTEIHYHLLTGLSYRIGTTGDQKEVLEDGAISFGAQSTGTVTLTDEAYVTVDLDDYAAFGGSTTSLTRNFGDFLFNYDDNIWTYDADFTIYTGTRELAANKIDYAKSVAGIKMKKNTAKPSFQKVTITEDEVSTDYAQLSIAKANQGDTITLPIYATSDTYAADGELGGLITTLTIKVYDGLTKVSLAGIKDKGTVQVALNEIASYKVSYSPSTANIFDAVPTVSSGDPGVTAEWVPIYDSKTYKITGYNLNVTGTKYNAGTSGETPEQVAAKNTYTIALWDYFSNAAYLTFDVEVTADTFATAESKAANAPQVTVNNISDTGATINASLPKGKKASALAGGNLLRYRIAVKTKAGNYVSRTGTVGNTTPGANDYVEPAIYWGSTYVNEKTIPVSWTGLTEETEYIAEVAIQRVVWDSENQVYKSIGTTDETTVPFTTAKHVTPTAMTLTKVNNTVYDTFTGNYGYGAGYIPVGKVVLDKGALNPVSTTDANGTAASGNVTVSTDDERVYAYVSNGILYAKYDPNGIGNGLTAAYLGVKSKNVTITVDPDGALVAKSIKVTVGRGIQNVMVPAPEVSLAKLNGKAASYTITPTLNAVTDAQGNYSAGVQPLSVKYTYAIEDASSAALREAVGKINNGKVNIPAKYVAQDGDYVAVRVTASDKDNRTSQSQRVTITLKSQAALIDQPAVAIWNDDAMKWDLYKTSSRALSAAELGSASIVVLSSYSYTGTNGKPVTAPVVPKDKWDKNGHAQVDEYITYGDTDYRIFVEDTEFTYTPAKFALANGNTSYAVGAPVVATGEDGQITVADLGTNKIGATLSVKVLANDGGSAAKTLSIKTAETVLPEGAKVDHIAYGNVSSGTGDSLTFTDFEAPSEITVFFVDGKGNALDEDIYKYTVTSKSSQVITVADEHQNLADYADGGNGGFKAYMKKAKTGGSTGDILITYTAYETNASGKQTAKAQKQTFTLTNEAFDAAKNPAPEVTIEAQPLVKVVDGAQTVSIKVTTTSGMNLTGADHVEFSLPADSYDTKTGTVKKNLTEAEAFVSALNDTANASYALKGTPTTAGTLTVTNSIPTLTKTAKFTILATVVDGAGDAVTGSGEVVIQPTALKKFVAPKTYTVAGANGYQVKLSEGAKFGDGEGNNVVDGAVYPVYKTVKDGKTSKSVANSFAGLFKVEKVDGTPYLAVDLTNASLIEEYLEAVLSAGSDTKAAKAVQEEYLTGYVKIYTDTLNPTNEYLTKVTVSITETRNLMTVAIKAANTANNAKNNLVQGITESNAKTWTRNDWQNNAASYEVVEALIAAKAGLTDGYGVKVSGISYEGAGYGKSTTDENGTGKVKITYNLTKDGVIAEVGYSEDAQTLDLAIDKRAAASAIRDDMMVAGGNGETGTGHLTLANSVLEATDLNGAIATELTTWLTDTAHNGTNNYFYATVTVANAKLSTYANGKKYIKADVTITTDIDSTGVTVTGRKFEIAGQQ